jgi:hypothetical protein
MEAIYTFFDKCISKLVSFGTHIIELCINFIISIMPLVVGAAGVGLAVWIVIIFLDDAN